MENTTPSSHAQVLVLGSTNWDICMYLPSLPKPGETVAGGSLHGNLGGKGANQAVACMKAGANTQFVSALGNDQTAQIVLKEFQQLGLDTQYLIEKPTVTGMACIFIDQNAENCIGLTAGANGQLDIGDVDAVADNIAQAGYLLMQLETPLESLLHAAAIAASKNTAVVLNPAPTQPLPDELLQNVDIITPNRIELSQLVGLSVDDDQQLIEATKALQAKGIQTVIVTLGEEGVLLVDDEQISRFKAPKVEAVDTTAAGDTFNGYLVAMLAQGKSMKQAIAIAVQAASLSVTRKGAIPSIPEFSETNQNLVEEQ